jgi:hypothetical protein
MLKKASLTVAALCLFSSAALGQSHYDVSGNVGAVFTSGASGNGITQSATDGSNYFATIRLKFNPKHSIGFTYGHTKNSQVYPTTFNFHVLDTITEYTGSYMYTPVKKGPFEPFLLAGAGALSFNPTSTWIFLPNYVITLPTGEKQTVPNRMQVQLGAMRQTQVAFLYGAGVDWRLFGLKRFALRLQYRGLLYTAPDFKVTTATGTGAVSFFTGGKANMSEPSIGLVFKF